MTQIVPVRYYAQLREALGASIEEVTFTFPIGESGILARLAALHPGQKEILLASRVAVEDRFLDSGASLEGLREAAVLDIISPISGG